MAYVDFVYSYIYQKLNTPASIEFDNERFKREVHEYLDEVNALWKDVEQEVLATISDLTGRNWEHERIPCWVLWTCSQPPFSDPLTLRVHYPKDGEPHKYAVTRFIDILVHELIHVNLTYGSPDLSEYFRWLIEERYAQEALEAASHVPIHAIHRKVFDAVFDDGRYEQELAWCAKFPAYERAWELVEQRGADEIIKELRAF